MSMARKQIRDMQHCLSLNIIGIEEEGDSMRDCRVTMCKLIAELDALMESLAGHSILFLDIAQSRLKASLSSKCRTKKEFISLLYKADESLERAAKNL